MLYLTCGLAGVVVGALTALLVFLVLLQRAADRDLIERRLRAYLQYREYLGDPGALLDPRRAGGVDPAAFRQVWKDTADFCREFRLTSWLLPQEEREALGRIAGDFEREARAAALEGDNREGGDTGGDAVPVPSSGVLQRLLDRRNAAGRILRRAVARETRRHRRFRFFPAGRGSAGEPAGGDAGDADRDGDGGEAPRE